MKKILAVVLALVMTLAMGTAAFAYVEVAPGQIFFGPSAAEYFANPGDTITIDFRYAGIPNESDGYPTDGYLVMPFIGILGDPNSNLLDSIALTDDAVAAGVTFIENPDSMYNLYFSPDEGVIMGAFMMPASLIGTDFNVFSVTTTVSADWVVVDYAAETPIDLALQPGEYGPAPAYFVSDEEAAAITAGEMLAEEAGIGVELMGIIGEANATIDAMPYQPTFEESLTEQLKGIGSALLDVLMIGINLLKGELAPSDWFIPGEHDVVDLSFVTDAIGKLVSMILHA